MRISSGFCFCLSFPSYSALEEGENDSLYGLVF
jgi:hypothetical protein